MSDEGSLKFQCEWFQAPPLPSEAIKEINAWRQQLYQASLIGFDQALQVGYGNLSVRVAHSRQFIISGTQTGKLPRLTSAHYSLVEDYNIDANHVTCRGPVRASSETLTHAAIYELTDEIRAVVHVHHEELWRRLRDKAPTTHTEVRYGTPEMGKEFHRLYVETDFAATRIAVMEGHPAGLISIGGGLHEAAQRLLDFLPSVRTLPILP